MHDSKLTKREEMKMELKGITLEEVAMLCHVKIHFYGFRKYDREVSDVVAEKMKADKDAGRYNKSLIERKGLKFLKGIAGEIRRFHRRNTLPWTDEDYRILPVDNHMDHAKGLRDKISEFEKQADLFCKTLPDEYKKAKVKLGDMWKEEDYPDIKDVRSKYWVEVKIKPIPTGSDFRIQKLDKKVMAQLKADVENEKKEAVKEAVTSLWVRLETPIKKMVEKLSDKEGEFRDSLVTNVESIVDLIPKMNLGDSNLLKFSKDVKAKLCSVDPKSLRKDPKVRKETAKMAKEILDKMSAYC
mgnify:CR=1 FL=1